MKFPIAWHEDCLRNAKESHERDLRTLEQMRKATERARVEIAIYEHQLGQAKAQGKDGFDREKFGRARKRNDAASSPSQEKS